MDSTHRIISFLVLSCAMTLALSACVARGSPAEGATAGSCGLALPATATDEDAVRAVLAAEGDLVVKQEIDALMALWAEGASVTDAKHTPHDDSDDQVWIDKDAIRHRYVRTVFPGAPELAAPVNLIFAWETDRVVITATTRIGGEFSPDGDRWVLVRSGGCWLLESLTYNLEPAPE